jgi:hypothetical protein
MPTVAYPKRPAFFAHRFTRLLFKACVANEIGTDALALLVAIVHTEDAKGYRGAVTFWNEQLMPLIGVNGVKSLIRIRNKAVEAGWLHYEQGGKGVVGRYWVLIPPDFDGVDDSPTDENRGDYQATCSVENAMTSAGEVEVQVQGKGKEKCSATGSTSDNLSSLTLPLTQDEEESPSVSGAAAPPAEAPTAKRPKKEPTGPHADIRRAFCERWKVKYGADYLFEFGKHGQMLKTMLAHVGGDVGVMVGIIERFLADDDPYFAAESRHDLARLRQHFARWQVPGTPTRAPKPAGGFKSKAQERDDIFAQQMFDAYGIDPGDIP